VTLVRIRIDAAGTNGLMKTAVVSFGVVAGIIGVALLALHVAQALGVVLIVVGLLVVGGLTVGGAAGAASGDGG
jgi:hypothetical protein